MKGYRTVLAGQETVRGMGGPLARTAADLSFFFGALDPLRLAALDPRVAPLPWEAPERVHVEGLRVGVYSDDGVLPASPGIVRAVERASSALRSRGATVVAFDPPGVRDLLSAYLGALSADGGAGLVEALEGGDVDPVLAPLRRMAAVPAGARRTLARVARGLGQRNLSLMLDAMGDKSVGELWRLTDTIRTYRTTPSCSTRPRCRPGSSPSPACARARRQGAAERICSRATPRGSTPRARGCRWASRSSVAPFATTRCSRPWSRSRAR